MAVLCTVFFWGLGFGSGSASAQQVAHGVRHVRHYEYEDPNFLYRLTLDSVLSPDSVNYECVARTIAVVRKIDHKLIQTIRPDENDPSCELSKKEYLIIEDINFDGDNDIRLIQSDRPANIPYYFWVYDRKTGLFRRKRDLEDITEPEFDHQKKVITSSWRGSCCDHGFSVYKYINGRPVLIEEMETVMDENDTAKYIITFKKRVNGKMKLVKQVVKKE